MPTAMLRTGRRRASSAGFSLVELLVVIAVAGILVALLLPALSKAKEKSRRSVCSENLHQDIIALTEYSDQDLDGLLPPALDDAGAYHSIVISHVTFTNLVSGYLERESNSLYCPNISYATGVMGGVSGIGYTIGYNYLAQPPPSLNPKGPDPIWTGPEKNNGTSEILADANYWSQSATVAATYVPHGSGGGFVRSASLASPKAAIANVSNNSSVPSNPSPGSTSAAFGAMGGNIGFLNGSVLWRPMRLMNQYSASSDGSSSGNW